MGGVGGGDTEQAAAADGSGDAAAWSSKGQLCSQIRCEAAPFRQLFALSCYRVFGFHCDRKPSSVFSLSFPYSYSSLKIF